MKCAIKASFVENDAGKRTLGLFDGAFLIKYQTLMKGRVFSPTTLTDFISRTLLTIPSHTARLSVIKGFLA